MFHGERRRKTDLSDPEGLGNEKRREFFSAESSHLGLQKGQKKMIRTRRGRVQTFEEVRAAKERFSI